MRGTLASRLILWIGVPATGLFLLVVLVSTVRSRNHVMRETELSSRNLARYHAERINTTLDSAAPVAEMIAAELELHPNQDEPGLTEYLGGVVARNKDRIYGSCIAFEPFSFDSQKQFLAPYLYWKGNAPEFVQLGNAEYNYFKWEWYDAPKRLNRPWWTEPYYDEGGGETIMITYSVPFRKAEAFWGIATIDIAMNDLTREVEKIKVGKRFGFVLSRTGKFLAFPDRSRIMKSSLFDLDPVLAKQMTSGEEGFVRTSGAWAGGDAWIAFMPIKTGGLSLAVVNPAAEITASAFALEKELLILGGVGMLSLGAVLILIVRSISKPVAQLAAAAQRVAAGDLDTELAPADRTLEFSDLTHAFQRMTADLKRRMEELRTATAARERIEGELQAARSIQMSLLPRRFPPFPDRTEFDIHAVVQPAREVGGDFYDFYFVDRDWLGVMIGDVAGKGVPAALYMAVTMTLMRAYMTNTFSPAEVLRRVNRELCADRETAMFVTLFCALLNCRTGSLVYCNAGHNPPFVLSENGALAKLSIPGGIALGAIEGARYENAETRLKRSDTLFCYTDGVTEANDRSGAFYTVERLAASLQTRGTLPPEVLTVRILEEVNMFSAESPRIDDITVLALKYAGIGPAIAASRGVAEASREAWAENIH